MEVVWRDSPGALLWQDLHARLMARQHLWEPPPPPPSPCSI